MRMVPLSSAARLWGRVVDRRLCGAAGPRDGFFHASSARLRPPPKSSRSTPAPAPPSGPRPRLINAKPGDVIELGEGRFDFTSTLSLDVSHVTLRGKGPDKTILSFKNQGAGTGRRGAARHQQGGCHPRRPGHRRCPR